MVVLEGPIHRYFGRIRLYRMPESCLILILRRPSIIECYLQGAHIRGEIDIKLQIAFILVVLHRRPSFKSQEMALAAAGKLVFPTPWLRK